MCVVPELNVERSHKLMRDWIFVYFAPQPFRWPSTVDCNDDDNDGGNGDSDGNGNGEGDGDDEGNGVVALAVTNTTIN